MTCKSKTKSCKCNSGIVDKEELQQVVDNTWNKEVHNKGSKEKEE